MKKIEIRLISKAFSGFLNHDGVSVLGDGYIRKTILIRELHDAEKGESLRMQEINSVCQEVTGLLPVVDSKQWRKDKDTYNVKINNRLSFAILVDK